MVDATDPTQPRLALSDVREPVPGETELLVQVMISGLNRADLAQVGDHYAPHTVAGSELTGEVVEVGSACVGFAIGDRILALCRGSHAELACVDHRLAVKLPQGVDWQTAASLPAWYMTAYDALITQGELRPGQSVLIQGVTSGVGQAAAQLARINGARSVIGVARSRAKLDRLTAEEVDLALGTEVDWPAAVRQATAGQGVSLIIDMVGGGVLGGNLECLAIGGRLIAVGRLGGAKDTLDIGTLAFKRIRLTGVTFRSRSLEEKATVARSFAAGVLPHVVRGHLKPRIDRTFALAEACAAQEYMRRNEHFGKVLLAVR